MTENPFEVPTSKDQPRVDRGAPKRQRRWLVVQAGCVSLVAPMMGLVLVLQIPGIQGIRHALQSMIALTFSCALILNVFVFRDRIASPAVILLVVSLSVLTAGLAFGGILLLLLLPNPGMP